MSRKTGFGPSIDGLAKPAAFLQTAAQWPELVNEQLGRYLAITPQQIQAVAAKVFRADNRVVLTYVPNEAGGGDAESEGDDDEEPAA